MLFAASNPGVQTVAPGAAAVFTLVEVPDRQGYVRPRLSAGTFLLSGGPFKRRRCCCSNINQTRDYISSIKADIAVPTGGTVGEISMALAIGGTTVSSSGMSATPAAVEEYFNIAETIAVDVFRGCCESVSFINTSDQPILVRNPYIVIDLPANRR